ncbi:MAG: aminotransferase class I/II-fold pyridoxal phosphate-dependent enzyme, partial [Chitinivibrionales bacterium]|nr:aminotransferase class I/II-fold pyridoxal phosphate-dependent enzyme [Chitinivibrionales bacterium]
MKTETKCVHAGTIVDAATRGINTPIYTSSVYEYLGSDARPYPRYFNVPNQHAVVDKLVDLENCEDGLLFSSGMAAIATVMLTFLKPGDHAVIQDDIYGGAHALVTDLLAERGIEFSFAAADALSIINCVRERTKLVYIESPTNPMLKIIDIRQVAQFFRSKGIVSVIDNTFASPINQNPATLGIDIIIHSGTKYLAGHSDLCCGAALGGKDAIAKIRKTAVCLGPSINAQSCALLERSLKTLALRVARQTENAGKIALFLSEHSNVALVNYPGLPAFQGHALASSQMSGFGAVVSFEIRENVGSAYEFMGRLALIKPALSLGGVETTICDPATTSHQKVSGEVKKRLGITDGLLRLSVGIEDCGDLINDLAQALK